MNLREEIKRFIEKERKRIGLYIENYLKRMDLPEPVFEAIKHISVNGGKRLRGIYLLFIVDLFEGERKKALEAAAAIEFFHSALLIYDDLPAMDNAVLRRGKPTVHRVFGEDMAILSGLAMINFCVGILSRLSDPRIMKSFTKQFHLLIWGQTLDLKDYLVRDEKDVEKVYEGKTASLFVLAAEIAAYLSGLEKKQLEALRDFSLAMGIAYQMVDDLIDLSSGPEKVGKDVGKDRDKKNALYFYGIDGVRKRIEELRKIALEAVKNLKEKGEKLTLFADFLLHRSF